MGQVNATEDAKRYREGYPGKRDNPNVNQNYRFYNGEIKSVPDGDTIDNIHTKWWGEYGLLEAHHGYVQWLFPIREDGLNYQAEQLQLHEAKKMMADPKIIKRCLKSYALMLDFYGMDLVNEKTGEIQRTGNYKSRYRNLNSSFHNYLRITRILKFLGEIGQEHLKKPFVKFIADEIFHNGELKNTYESLYRYWIPVLRNDNEREEMLQYCDNQGKSEVKPTELQRPNIVISKDDIKGLQKNDDDDDDIDDDEMDIDQLNQKVLKKEKAKKVEDKINEKEDKTNEKEDNTDEKKDNTDEKKED
eukprot:TRINITY_DN6666_c0_g1_i1.p1 TRINITY_DN6666_c0_g1~~TRINITY_DN6666_c0_g1_i1.p1  ORF type:complete len:303 (+),score=59.38 TRINITY_DN6666_c0_g1_i1:43-951(+)